MWYAPLHMIFFEKKYESFCSWESCNVRIFSLLYASFLEKNNAYIGEGKDGNDLMHACQKKLNSYSEYT